MKVMGSRPDKVHWGCWEEHPVIIVAPVAHLNKSSGCFNKNPFHQGFLTINLRELFLKLRLKNLTNINSCKSIVTIPVRTSDGKGF